MLCTMYISIYKGQKHWEIRRRIVYFTVSLRLCTFHLKMKRSRTESAAHKHTRTSKRESERERKKRWNKEIERVQRIRENGSTQWEKQRLLASFLIQPTDDYLITRLSFDELSHEGVKAIIHDEKTTDRDRKRIFKLITYTYSHTSKSFHLYFHLILAFFFQFSFF